MTADFICAVDAVLAADGGRGGLLFVADAGKIVFDATGIDTTGALLSANPGNPLPSQPGGPGGLGGAGGLGGGGPPGGLGGSNGPGGSGAGQRSGGHGGPAGNQGDGGDGGSGGSVPEPNRLVSLVSGFMLLAALNHRRERS